MHIWKCVVALLWIKLIVLQFVLCIVYYVFCILLFEDLQTICLLDKICVLVQSLMYFVVKILYINKFSFKNMGLFHLNYTKYRSIVMYIWKKQYYSRWLQIKNLIEP